MSLGVLRALSEFASERLLMHSWHVSLKEAIEIQRMLKPVRSGRQAGSTDRQKLDLPPCLFNFRHL